MERVRPERILPTMPASYLRQDQAAILERTKLSPIVLTHRGEAAGVLVSVAYWNALADALDDLTEQVTALEIEVAARGSHP